MHIRRRSAHSETIARQAGAKRLDRSDVVAAYEALLGRQPESESVLDAHLRHGSFAELLRAIADSPEYAMRMNRSPFFFYNSSFDVAAVIKAHEDPARTPKAGHVVNYLGVAINRDFLPLLKDVPELEGPPIPANWHADMAEFGAALRAVDLAHGRFTMIELGCGWGCWMNITGVAARRRGLAVRLIGVEGDEGHIGFAHKALATNGFAASDYVLHRGIAAARPGVALFPRQEHAGNRWGLEPVFGASEAEADAAVRGGRYDRLPMISLEAAIGGEPRIDLLHIDIQGGEADLIRDCRELLSAKVGYIVVGTHSRQIEGRVMEDLLAAGWKLEIERPGVFSIVDGVPVVTVDGVQGWRNLRNMSG
ncbi:MAG TPA: class I SAM-dependent methyltransferase [Bauldia sp.]|nr:class I SAM-dependent methyltransferase [Bauldia sp.]